MPLQVCGEGGYKWGEAGKCFTGAGARAKALAQGRAIGATEEEIAAAEATVSDVHTEGLTPGGKFSKGNKRGSPKKKNKRGRPFAERAEVGDDLDTVFERRQREPTTFEFR